MLAVICYFSETPTVAWHSALTTSLASRASVCKRSHRSQIGRSQYRVNTRASPYRISSSLVATGAVDLSPVEPPDSIAQSVLRSPAGAP